MKNHPLDKWAEGSREARAVVHLLTHAFDGALATPSQPHIVTTPDGWTILSRDALGCAVDAAHSDSEQRILAVAHSLLTGAPVDLSWATASLDRRNATALVEAVAIAVGLDDRDDERYAAQRVIAERAARQK